MHTKGMDDRYDEDYYLRGQESGKSLYKDFRWLPDLTIPMCTTVANHCGIKEGDTIMDFGCARGYMVKGFRHIGYEAWGTDVSEWALKNCDVEVRSFLSSQWPPAADQHVDWITAKDVLEHIPMYNVGTVLKQFAEYADKGVFIVVPLSKGLGLGYEVAEYEEDVTHELRWPLDQWVSELMHAFDHRWEISMRYRISGIKDNYAGWEKGNGFITCKRIT